VVQDRERAAGETYRLGEPNRYNDYAPGVQVGAAAPGGTQWCEMRFRSYNPATGTYMGFDGVPHACP
jgi:BA14K-like protein